jgi:F-type H+-transporting ATPase subunit b
MGGFSTLLESLHIEWSLILAQAVNFLLLLAVLTKLVYRPLLRALSERRRAIETSLEKAAEIEKHMQRISEQHREQLAKTHKEAQRIIEAARAQASEEKQTLLASAKDEVEALVARAHKDVDQQKEDMLQDARAQMADILVPALEAVLSRSVDEDIKKALTARATRDIQKHYSH